MRRTDGTNYSDAELRRFFDKIDVDRSGLIDAAEFQKMKAAETFGGELRQLGSVGGASREFRKFDVDNTGTLDFEEFKQLIVRTEGDNYTDRELRRRFAFYDTDGGGRIDKAEYERGKKRETGAATRSFTTTGTRRVASDPARCRSRAPGVGVAPCRRARRLRQPRPRHGGRRRRARRGPPRPTAARTRAATQDVVDHGRGGGTRGRCDLSTVKNPRVLRAGSTACPVGILPMQFQIRVTGAALLRRGASLAGPSRRCLR